MDLTRAGDGFAAVVTIGLSDPEAVEPLLDLLVREVEDWVAGVPGFVSANYHVANDGTRVLNYAQWASEEAYRGSFAHNPGSGSLRDAILAVPGVESLEMVGYTLRRSVTATAAATPPSDA
jgi:C-6 monooxygenase